MLVAGIFDHRKEKEIAFRKVGLIAWSSLEDGGTSTPVKSSAKLKEKLFPVINLRAHLSNLQLNLTEDFSYKSTSTPVKSSVKFDWMQT